MNLCTHLRSYSYTIKKLHLSHTPLTSAIPATAHVPSRSTPPGLLNHTSFAGVAALQAQTHFPKRATVATQASIPLAPPVKKRRQPYKAKVEMVGLASDMLHFA
jgi:hypothetical protein